MRNTKSSEKLDMILDLYRQEEYLTYVQIAEKTGVCEATVRKCINNSIKEGIIEKRKQKRKREISQKTRDEYYEVLKLYQQEEYLTYEEIAKKVGIPLTTVYTYIKKAVEFGTIEKRKICEEDRIKKNPMFNMVVDLYRQEEYLTYKEIADKIGVSTDTVYSYIRKGLELGLIERREPREKEKREKNFNIVLELYQSQENLSYAEISRRSDIPHTTVRIYVEKAISMGLVERRKKQNKEQNNEQNKKQNNEQNNEQNKKQNNEQNKKQNNEQNKKQNNEQNKKQNNEQSDEQSNEKKKSRYIEAIELYKSGYTTLQIANELGVSKTSVYNYLKQAEEKGLIKSRHERGRRENTELYNEIIRLFKDEKMEYKQIAEKLGIRYNSVEYYVDKARKEEKIGDEKARGIIRRPKFNEVITLYKGKVKVDEIAELSGLSIHTIYRYIQEAKNLGLITESDRIKINPTFKKVIDIYNSGENLTLADVSKKTGMSISSVCQYKKRGIILGLIEEKRKKITLEEFSEKIRGYIKAKDYKTAIKLMDNFSGYFQDENPEDIMRAKKEIKEELDRARSSYVEEETQNNGEDVAETR